MRVFTPEHQIAAWQESFEEESKKRRMAEQERDRMTQAVTHHIADLRATADLMASDATIGESFASTIAEIRKAADELEAELEGKE